MSNKIQRVASSLLIVLSVLIMSCTKDNVRTPMNLEDYAAISAGGTHSIFLDSDGALWGTGSDTYGQLIDGEFGQWTFGWLPLLIGHDFKSISAGENYSLGLKTDGTLWAWGKNVYSQLGDGTKVNAIEPLQVGSDYKTIAAGVYHSLAIKTDGTLWAWGSNHFGQLGDGTNEDKTSPVQIGVDYVAIATGKLHSLGLKTDGTLWSWGYNDSGVLGNDNNLDENKPVQIGVGYSEIACGYYHSMALKTNGTLWTWGSNFYGQLGDGAYVDKTKPTQIGTDFAEIALGGNHSLALKTDGTLWSWGSNTFGQVGGGATGEWFNTNIPVMVGQDFALISAGYEFSLALKTDGTLWGWGQNSYGQLGNVGQSYHTSPVRVGPK